MTGREYIIRSRNIYGSYESCLVIDSVMNYAHNGLDQGGFADFDYIRLESPVGPANHFDANQQVNITYYDTENNTNPQRSFANLQSLTPNSNGAWVCFKLMPKLCQINRE